MEKASIFIKKGIQFLIILYLFALMILSHSGIIEGQELISVPKYYGFYILKQGVWLPLLEMATSFYAPLKCSEGSWGILCLDSKPEILTEEQRPTILAYDPKMNINELSLVRLWYFKKLKAVYFHGEPPDPGLFEKLYGVERNSILDFGKWTAVGTYSFKAWPVTGHPEMLYIRPEEKFSPGVYAVCQSKNFTSLPVQADLKIPLRSFEIIGTETGPPDIFPVDNPRVKVMKSCVSNRLEGIEKTKGGEPVFSVSEKKLFAYIELKGYRSGEIIEFIWYRPDGSIQARNKQILSLPFPGRTSSVSQEMSPSHLLLPGRWMLAVKVYGELVVCLKFNVDIY